MGILRLHFEVPSSAPASANVLDAEVALELAVGCGYEVIQVDWAGMFCVELPVEDDVMFLVEAAHQLREGELPVRHEVFLGDGGFQIEADISEKKVSMRVIHTPYLDKRFSEEAIKILPQSAYIAAWNSLMAQLQAQLPKTILIT